jgi:hypothetical protein
LAKTPFVLQALNILGPDEILKLSEVLHAKQINTKKAAGEELLVWEHETTEDQSPSRGHANDQESKVLDFPVKKTIRDLDYFKETTETKPVEEAPAPGIMTSDLLFWQRELAKHTGEGMRKADAFKGYSKSTEMYVVKSPLNEGKEKIRFAATNGVLVNKKQA